MEVIHKGRGCKNACKCAETHILKKGKDVGKPIAENISCGFCQGKYKLILPANCKNRATVFETGTPAYQQEEEQQAKRLPHREGKFSKNYFTFTFKGFFSF